MKFAAPAAGAAMALLAAVPPALAEREADDPPSPERLALSAPVAGHVTVSSQMRAARRDVQERRLRGRVTRLERRVARVRGDRPERPRWAASRRPRCAAAFAACAASSRPPARTSVSRSRPSSPRSPPASPAATRPPSAAAGSIAASTSSRSRPGPRSAAAAIRRRRRRPSRTCARRCCTSARAPLPGLSAGAERPPAGVSSFSRAVHTALIWRRNREQQTASRLRGGNIQRFAAPRRLLFYSHDGVGLGHVRRNLAIAAAVVEADARAAVLIATSADEIAEMSLPPAVDVLKLPGLRKLSNGRYASRRLRVDPPDLHAVRSAPCSRPPWLRSARPCCSPTSTRSASAASSAERCAPCARAERALGARAARHPRREQPRARRVGAGRDGGADRPALRPRARLRRPGGLRPGQRVRDAARAALDRALLRLRHPPRRGRAQARTSALPGRSCWPPRAAARTATGCCGRSWRRLTACRGRQRWCPGARDRRASARRCARPPRRRTSRSTIPPDLAEQLPDVDALVCMGGYNTLVEAVAAGCRRSASRASGRGGAAHPRPRLRAAGPAAAGRAASLDAASLAAEVEHALAAPRCCSASCRALDLDGAAARRGQLLELATRRPARRGGPRRMRRRATSATC